MFLMCFMFCEWVVLQSTIKAKKTHGAKTHYLSHRHNTNIIVAHLRKINSIIKNMLIIGTANLCDRLGVY